MSGGGGCIRVLHSGFNPNLLPQDASESPTAGDSESDGDATAGQLEQRRPADVHSRQASVLVVRRPVQAHLDAGQAEDRAARGVLLHRVRLQRLVHVRTHHPVRRQSQQAGVHAGTGQPDRSNRNRLLLPRLHPDLSEEGERRVGVLQHHPHHATFQGACVVSKNRVHGTFIFQ